MNTALCLKQSAQANTTSPTLSLDLNYHLLLQGVIEGLPDGVIILSDRGEVLYQNSRASRICRQLVQTSPQPTSVPRSIWRRCQALIDSRHLIPDQPVVIEDEIKTGNPSGEAVDIRIRVRWLDSARTEHPRLLVTLEDQLQSAQCRAIAEAHQYHLTDRETEVWLLKRVGYSYKAIAAKLHIAEDTVKKHIKSIYARREASEWPLE